MKKGSHLFKQPLKVLCNFLILFAPLVLVETSSAFFWGEPECPDILKKLISTK